MKRGKFKAILLIIVFLLMLAIIVNVLLDMSSDNDKAADGGTDPYLTTPTPQTETTPPPVETAALTPTPAPTPTPTAAPTPTPTPTPTPAPTLTPQPIPADTVIGSGEFGSETGVPMNIRAVWTASVTDAETVCVTVDVYLDSYQLNIKEAYNSVNVSVGSQYVSANSPTVAWDKNEQLSTLMASTRHYLPLAAGQSDTFPLAVEYHFGGVYSKKELPVIECGGNITLSR